MKKALLLWSLVGACVGASVLPALAQTAPPPMTGPATGGKIGTTGHKIRQNMHGKPAGSNAMTNPSTGGKVGGGSKIAKNSKKGKKPSHVTTNPSTGGTVGGSR